MRPAFLSRPGLWTRAPRTSTSPVDEAYAIQRPARSDRHVTDWMILFIGIIVALVLLASWIAS